MTGHAAGILYNDTDPGAAAWLRQLIRERALPYGYIDTRSISDLGAADAGRFEQCHFFAGIGGWPYALQLAGWRGPVWTGSCPCQPFSAAGKRRGVADERHLWPAFRGLIAECRPKRPSAEYLAAAKAAIGAVARAGGTAQLGLFSDLTMQVKR